LTNDLVNLNIRANEYTGNEHIRVGNGQGLRILHTGLASLPSTHRTFYLPSLLHVPEFTKHLLFVNQFTKYNNVYIEFHPRFFYVKDHLTHRLLLQGPSKRGLYSLLTKTLCTTLPLLLLRLLKIIAFEYSLQRLHCIP
jgi:hypothetical protein